MIPCIIGNKCSSMNAIGETCEGFGLGQCSYCRCLKKSADKTEDEIIESFLEWLQEKKLSALNNAELSNSLLEKWDYLAISKRIDNMAADITRIINMKL